MLGDDTEAKVAETYTPGRVESSIIRSETFSIEKVIERFEPFTMSPRTSIVCAPVVRTNGVAPRSNVTLLLFAALIETGPATLVPSI